MAKNKKHKGLAITLIIIGIIVAGLVVSFIVVTKREDNNAQKNYVSWTEGTWESAQREYTEPTQLLGDDGTLLASGWAKHNVFEYDRTKVTPELRRKEWDFYQLSNGKMMVQISMANLSFGGYVGATLVDLVSGEVVATKTGLFLGGKDKYVLPANSDEPNIVKGNVGKAEYEFNTQETSRTLHFSMGDVVADFQMDILPNQENITTVFPFEGTTDRYFYTTKQNCLPCEGTFKVGDETYTFTKDDTFCVLDWGRVNTPYHLMWYWGNGSTYLYDEDGTKHTFGFEITWGIGDETGATETALFYDGKVHKFDAVDVETFPKPDKFMEPWVIKSKDGRFNMTMTPFFDYHTDTNALIMRNHCHQVHGLWNGYVILDDGTKLEIKDMYAFCEYLEDRW